MAMAATANGNVEAMAVPIGKIVAMPAFCAGSIISSIDLDCPSGPVTVTFPLTPRVTVAVPPLISISAFA